MQEISIITLSLLAKTKAEKDSTRHSLLAEPGKLLITEQEIFAFYKTIKHDITLEAVSVALKQATEIYYSSKAKNIVVLAITDQNYPAALKNIPDPPLVLYAKGNIAALQEKMVAVVGTRNVSAHGREKTISITKDLATRGFVIVSGLALGVDTKAHQATLEVEAKTVAVLAHGLDTIYPVENTRLAAEIIAKNGCLISEYPLGFKATRYTFVHRDRIQSGLSSAVVVVETDIKGGTMHTANFCKKQKRKLACVDFTAAGLAQPLGNKKLIEEDAALAIKSAENVMELARAISVPARSIASYFVAGPAQLTAMLPLAESKQVAKVPIQHSNEQLKEEPVDNTISNKRPAKATSYYKTVELVYSPPKAAKRRKFKPGRR